MANDKFYIKDETHFNVPTNREVVLKDQLYFSTTIKSLGGPKMDPNVFEDRATKQHVAEHSTAFNDFMAANPGFILPWDRVPDGPSFAHVEQPVGSVEHPLEVVE